MKETCVSTKFRVITRRRFAKFGALGVAAVPVSGLLHATRLAQAADLPQLDEGDPTAQSFGYKHDASQVDVAKFPKRNGPDGANQFCKNCQLFTADAGAALGPCSIFPGKSVNADGWCNAWVAKAG